MESIHAAISSSVSRNESGSPAIKAAREFADGFVAVALDRGKNVFDGFAHARLIVVFLLPAYAGF